MCHKTQVSEKVEFIKLFLMVSIIIPTYNSSFFISQAIESVLVQTYKDWEALVIDDCSTDDSANIIKSYCQKDERIKYLKTEYASGSPTLPRNIGIKNSQGRYIAFLDSDDIWLPNKLETQLHLFSDNKTVIVYSNYEKIAENGQRNSRIVVAPFTMDYQHLLLGNVIGCLTAIYDTEKVGKVYFSDYPHEDYIMWLSILKKGYIARNTNTVTALYRVRYNSVSSNKLKVISWQWEIYRSVEKLGYWKSVLFFISYAYKAFRKSLV